jgi:CRISPR-associated protein Csd1
MLLQALAANATRLDDLGPPMYKRTPVRYEVHLDQAGNGLGIVTLSRGEGKRNDRGLELLAPAMVRTSGLKPILLADRGDYALGWGDDPRTAANHATFVELVRDCAAETGDPGVHAVLAYLERPPEERLPMPADADPKMNVTFNVAGRRPIDSPVVQAFWAARTDRSATDGGTASMQCMVCREQKPVLPRLPFLIKGLGPVGGQPAGTALVSANSDVFESYGLKNNFTAPMCSACAERVCKALNALIENEATRRYLGRILFVFWTREPTDLPVWELIDRADAGQVDAFLASVRTARVAATTLDTNAFYLLGLSGSGGRVAVRDWIDISAEEAQRNLVRYFRLQRIVDRFGVVSRYFGLYTLSAATVREGSRDAPPPDVPRALLRLALRGGVLPESLIAQVVRRIRAGQAVSQPQAALLKLVLASQQPEGMEETLTALDRDNRDPAYLCGRLLAVLDDIQRAALGARNATIIDRFFGSASTAPIAVFGRLIKGAQPHLGRLRRDKPGLYYALDARLQEIMRDLDTFPRTLTLRQQGLFVLGFYHQRAADTQERLARAAARRAGEVPATPDDDLELLDAPMDVVSENEG